MGDLPDFEQMAIDMLLRLAAVERSEGASFKVIMMDLKAAYELGQRSTPSVEECAGVDAAYNQALDDAIKAARGRYDADRCSISLNGAEAIESLRRQLAPSASTEREKE